MTNDEELPTDAPERGLETHSEAETLPFAGLLAPEPLTSAPPVGARFLAFGSILVGGLLGALIGYGTAELMAGSGLWAGLGAVLGGAIGAVGVGIVASLTLRAMNEWRAVQHPEAGSKRPDPSAADGEARRG